MKRVVKSLMMIGALLASSSAFGFLGCFGGFENFSPYIGVDAQRTYLRGQGDWDRVFPNMYTGADVYVGTKIGCYWGAELGWDWNPTRSRDYVLQAGATFMGITPNAAHNIHAEIRKKGYHIDLLGFMPLGNCWEWLAGIGAGWIDPRITITDQTNGVGATNNTLQSALLSTTGKSKWVLRLKTGLTWMFSECLGFRALIGWENTRVLRVEGNSSFNAFAYHKNGFDNSTTVSLGAFVRF